MKTKKLLGGLVLGAAALMPVSDAFAADEVNIYSYRQQFLIQPMLDKFTAETGIKTNVVFAKKGMVERIVREGANSPVDVILTVDIGRLHAAKDAGVTQSIESDTLNGNIPAQYRDRENHWFATTTRARIIYASKDRVKPGEIASYEDLADPKWKGRVCTRSGTNVYQVALTASMIAHHGTEGAKNWLQGVKANLARKPQGNDRAQVKAIKEGICDVSLGNNYYYGKMLANEEQRAWADSVNLVFPNQGDRGTHVNVAGIALAKHAPNRDAAVKLIEFLSSDVAQTMYADVNFEYPVKPGVAYSDVVKSWGSFEADKLPLDEVALLRKAAIMLTDEVGYNE